MNRPVSAQSIARPLRRVRAARLLVAHQSAPLARAGHRQSWALRGFEVIRSSARFSRRCDGCHRCQPPGRWRSVRLRNHPDDRCCRRRLQLYARIVCERLARLCCPLSRRKSNPMCRWGRARHDGPLQHPCGRLIARRGIASHACFRRGQRRNNRDRCLGQNVGGHLHRYPGNSLRLNEGRCRHSDHGSGDSSIRIVDFGHLCVVVGVVDDRVVDDRVALVDVLEVSAAGRVSRLIDLARPQREPRNAFDGAGGNGQLKILAPDKHNECRRVVGASAHRAGHPTPCPAEVCPAAVVRHGEAPRGVIYPGPTPGVDPLPMAVAVGCPVRGHSVPGTRRCRRSR